MLRKVYLTESFICAIESTQCPQFFFPVFLHTKNMTFHFQCTAQLKTGNWEWLWGHLRTLRFAATKLIFQSFLAFSTEAGALNCISLFWWFFGAIHSLDGYPHDKRLLSCFDFNFFVERGWECTLKKTVWSEWGTEQVPSKEFFIATRSQWYKTVASSWRS